MTCFEMFLKLELLNLLPSTLVLLTAATWITCMYVMCGKTLRRVPRSCTLNFLLFSLYIVYTTECIYTYVPRFLSNLLQNHH